jgi:hypothetical protein
MKDRGPLVHVAQRLGDPGPFVFVQRGASWHPVSHRATVRARAFCKGRSESYTDQQAKVGGWVGLGWGVGRRLFAATAFWWLAFHLFERA